MDRSDSASHLSLPLLTTKLRVPKKHGALVYRDGLLAKMHQALSFPVTLIAAPAGFGKTTLVITWLEHVDVPVVWISLDEEDRDFARFCSYLIAALQAIWPKIGTALMAMVQSSSRARSQPFITLLINELATVSEEFILVLDDYHEVETEDINQALSFLIDHMPSSMHLVITSRADPDLSLARLRASGQLNEIRGADLRFSLAEASDFLRQVTGLTLSDSQIVSLQRRTEGWIAGLQMAAISLQKRDPGSVAQFIEDFGGSHRYIMDYLVDEVLNRQLPEIQAFLLCTSILDKLSGPLCEAILRSREATDPSLRLASLPAAPDAATAQDQLTQLERANLFIAPLDDQRHWYRYHPLFAELLRQRLQQAYPDQVRALHLAASQWFEQAGLTHEAVQHALAAQAFDRAAVLVQDAALAFIERSEIGRMLNWLDGLPEHVIETRPLLGLYYVWILFFSGQVAQAAARLDAIEATLAADEAKRTPIVQSYVAAMRARLLRDTGDLASTITLSRRALAHLPKQDRLFRDMVTLSLAAAHYLQGEFEPASQLLTDSIATGQTAQLPLNTFSATYIQTRLLRAQGALQQALRLCRDGLEWIGKRGWQDFPSVGFLYVALGDVFCERGDLAAAADYLERGVRLGQEGGHPAVLLGGNVALAWLRHIQGDATRSQEAIRIALQYAQEHQVSRYWPVPSAAVCQARLWILQGNLDAAAHLTQQSGLQGSESSLSYLHEADHLTLVRLWIAQRNLEAAEELLSRLHQEAASAGRNGSLIEILILQALNLAAQKRNHEALSSLGRALALAEPEGFVRLFLDEGPAMTELLRQAVSQGVHAPYALHLLEAAGETPQAPQPLIDPLSERELDVLRRVSAGYSNQEIAQDLVLATSTVKKHINNIYNKLGVSSRTQAAAKARELRLL